MQVTQLLMDWRAGNQQALDDLIPLVQAAFKRRARASRRRERPGHTLQTSALVNEAFLRLLDQQISWQTHAHFFGMAAQLMRRGLVDHARAQSGMKRRGDQQRISRDAVAAMPDARAAELVALEDALTTLVPLDARPSQVVEWRYFSGFTIDETAEVLGISTATVEREWTLARAFLRRFITN